MAVSKEKNGWWSVDSIHEIPNSLCLYCSDLKMSLLRIKKLKNRDLKESYNYKTKSEKIHDTVVPNDRLEMSEFYLSFAMCDRDTRG